MIANIGFLACNVYCIYISFLISDNSLSQAIVYQPFKIMYRALMYKYVSSVIPNEKESDF